MPDTTMSVGELADAAGLSRRAIRFYVQKGLLPPPGGRGRGRHYGSEHLERLNRIRQLQAAGHGLEAIRRILEGGAESPLPVDGKGRRRPAADSTAVSLWTRVRIAEGAELHLDARRHNLTTEQILAAREAVRAVLEEGA